APAITIERPALARAPTRPPAPGSALFDLLFDDLGFGEVPDGDGGAVPIELEAGAVPVELDADRFESEDSGVVSTADVEAAGLRSDDTATARQALTAEHQRIQNADHYAVLMVGRRARPPEIAAAYAARRAQLDRDSPEIRDPRDRAKLDELRRVYEVAHAALSDERARAAYDRELAGGELVQGPPGVDAELSFRKAEELMARGQ